MITQKNTFCGGGSLPRTPPEAECSEFRSAEMPEVGASEQGQTPTPPMGGLHDYALVPASYRGSQRFERNVSCYSFSSVNAEIDCKIIYHNLYGK